MRHLSAMARKEETGLDHLAGISNGKSFRLAHTVMRAERGRAKS